ncbi:sensor histidine kinase [Salibacterium lacus]|uniref:histidine kinase n=1 Tax=Salibacterium lacus TaxID=1898109 RepID=A0ABW5T2T5_9BACI
MNILPFKWKLPQSLRYQLLVRMLLILSFILFIIGILQFFVMKGFLYQNEAETLQARLMSIPAERLINEENLPQPRQENGAEPIFVQEFSLGLIEDGEASNVLGEDGLAVPQLSEDTYEQMMEPEDLQQHVVTTDPNGNRQMVVFRPAFQRPGGVEAGDVQIIQMGVSTAPLQQLLWRQLLIFVSLSALALAAGLVIYFSVIRKTLRPLSNIVESVKHMNADRLDDRIPDSQGQEEIDRLSRSFNDMLERLNESFEQEKETKEQMRRFIADASHELRTPITSVHGYLEVLLRGAAQKPEQLSKALHSMHGETRRVMKLVEELLLLAKLDQTPELELQHTNLSMLIRDMEPQLAFLAGNRHLVMDLADDVDIMCDADKTRQVILNLFHNAVEHTDAEDGKIELFLEQTGDGVQLRIQDNGPGIRAENQKHIFDRFYREDSSRSRRSGGAGLGLSISRSIMDAHHGGISVESKEGTGTTFILYWSEMD